MLIDMSDVDVSVEGRWTPFEITIRYDGLEYKFKVNLVPSIVGPPPPVWFINPEAGLYGSDGLEKQGLLLARQNQRMAVYPLIYDDSGSSEWLIGPGGIVEDVFFSELFELTGGQCLGCPPLDEPTVMNKVGKLTMLMDSEGLIQVKVNDGLFKTYQQSEFGYGNVDIGGQPKRKIPDLSGRWAFVEGDTEWGVGGSPPPTIYLPLVFDITLESVFKPTLVVTVFPPGHATYSIQNMAGEEVAKLICEYQIAMSCNLDSPDNHDGFYIKLLSPERMIMTSLSPVSSGGAGTGIAVRID